MHRQWVPTLGMAPVQSGLTAWCGLVRSDGARESAAGLEPRASLLSRHHDVRAVILNSAEGQQVSSGVFRLSRLETATGDHHLGKFIGAIRLPVTRCPPDCSRSNSRLNIMRLLG